jgi:hypothetical protein
MIGFYKDSLLTTGVDEVARIMGSRRDRPRKSCAATSECASTRATSRSSTRIGGVVSCLALRKAFRISKGGSSAPAADRARRMPRPYVGALQPVRIEPVYLHQSRRAPARGASRGRSAVALDELPNLPDADRCGCISTVPLFMHGARSGSARRLRCSRRISFTNCAAAPARILDETLHLRLWLPEDLSRGRVKRSPASTRGFSASSAGTEEVES